MSFVITDPRVSSFLVAQQRKQIPQPKTTPKKIPQKLSPAVVQSQQDLATRFGITTFDRSGNVTNVGAGTVPIDFSPRLEKGPQGKVTKTRSPDPTLEKSVVGQIRLEQRNAELANLQQQLKVNQIRNMNFGVATLQGELGGEVPSLGKDLQKRGTTQFISETVGDVRNPSFTFGSVVFAPDGGLATRQSTRGFLQSTEGRQKISERLPTPDNILAEISQRQSNLGLNPFVAPTPKRQPTLDLVRFADGKQRAVTPASANILSQRGIATVVATDVPKTEIKKAKVRSISNQQVTKIASSTKTGSVTPFPFLGGGLAGSLTANFGDNRAGLFVFPPAQEPQSQNLQRPPEAITPLEQIDNFRRGFVAGAANLQADILNLYQLGGQAFAELVDPTPEGVRNLGRERSPLPTTSTPSRTLEEGIFDVPFAVAEGRPVLGDQGSLAGFGQRATEQFKQEPAFSLGVAVFDVGSLFVPIGTISKAPKIAVKVGTKAATKNVVKKASPDPRIISTPESGKVIFKISKLRNLGFEDSLTDVQKEVARDVARSPDDLAQLRPTRETLEQALKEQEKFNIDANKLPDFQSPKNRDFQLTKEAERRLLKDNKITSKKPSGKTTSQSKKTSDGTSAKGTGASQSKSAESVFTRFGDDTSGIGGRRGTQILKKPSKSRPKPKGKDVKTPPTKRPPLKTIGTSIGVGLTAGVGAGLLNDQKIIDVPDTGLTFFQGSKIDEPQIQSPVLDPDLTTDVGIKTDQTFGFETSTQNPPPFPPPQTPTQTTSNPPPQVPRLGLLEFGEGGPRPFPLFDFPFFPFGGGASDSDNPASDKKFFRVFDIGVNPDTGRPEPFAPVKVGLGFFEDSLRPNFEIKRNVRQKGKKKGQRIRTPLQESFFDFSLEGFLRG